MKSREYQCDYKNVLPYFTSLEENAAQILQALWQSQDLPLALRRPFWLYFSAANTLKPVTQNWGLFYLLFLPLILQQKAHKRKKSPFPNISRASRSLLNAVCCANTNLRQFYRACYLPSYNSFFVRGWCHNYLLLSLIA